MTKAEMKQLLEKAATKAMADESFKKKLLEDANSAIKAEYGEELPCKVTLHPSSEKEVVFVLPGHECCKCREHNLSHSAYS